MENYPTIAFLLRWGNVVAAAVALMIALGAAALVLQGWSVAVLVIGGLTAVLAWGLLRSYVEVLRVIADTLIPK